MNKTTIKQKILKEFMARVNKLSVGRTTSDKWYGTVTCKSHATKRGSYGQKCGRSAYGTRTFSVSGSKMIHNGKYTLKSLRAKLEAAIA